MFVPWLTVPATALFIVAAERVPNLNVTPSCKGAAQAGYIATTEERLKSCIDTELRTRDKLNQDWSSFPVADRVWCVSATKGFEPTYSELATCLEMKRDLRTMKPPEAEGPARVRRP